MLAVTRLSKSRPVAAIRRLRGSGTGPSQSFTPPGGPDLSVRPGSLRPRQEAGGYYADPKVGQVFRTFPSAEF